MTTRLRLFVFSAVVLSAFAQIILKHGMSHPDVKRALVSENLLRIIRSVMTNWLVVGGLAMYLVSMAFWLLVLAKLDVSQAYPFVGAGFLITMAFGYLFLGESISLSRLVGTVLVALGIIFVSKS
jgi:multidrug transporter EmrE-like cation transporter